MTLRRDKLMSYPLRPTDFGGVCAAGTVRPGGLWPGPGLRRVMAGAARRDRLRRRVAYLLWVAPG